MCNVKVKKAKNSKIFRKHLYFRFQFSQNNEKIINILFYGILNLVNILILDLEKTKNLKILLETEW